MIEKLRQETRKLHEEIEGKNPANKILDRTIDLESYKLLLLNNYRAYSTTETEIKKFWPLYLGKKHLELQKDLKQLGISVDSPVKNDTFECHSRAEALGAAYVVEGSALGGMVLAKNLKNCAALKRIERHYFFSGDKENLQDWRNFKRELEQYKFSKTEEKEAIEKAKDTFKFFSTVFEQEYQVD